MKAHWADPLLVNMTVRCRLLILIQPLPAHPRAYLLDPLFAEHYGLVHPHPRYDQLIEYEGKRIPGLCIYSASEFEYDPRRDDISKFLNQLTIYTARHLVWLRTRQLFRGFPPNGVLLRVLLPGETLINDMPSVVFAGDPRRMIMLDYWSGYWPGPTARAFNPATHLKFIGPNQQCWCGSGSTYKSCHRPLDKAKLAISR
ncbi:SEC-C metal-binding domain-containing protein [Acidicapsa dinghuensis]|uniref:SEC-C metal-binding domain-containing protein n=1 Tax=Acidicapsa dinghuensis TaxID=2218256 RepID=A0ABW1EJ88_9BACT